MNSTELAYTDESRIMNLKQNPIGVVGMVERNLTKEEEKVLLQKTNDKQVAFHFTINQDGSIEDINIPVGDWRSKDIAGNIKVMERKLKLKAKLQKKLVEKGKVKELSPEKVCNLSTLVR